MEGCSWGVQGRQWSRVEHRLQRRVTLGNINDVAMDVVNRTTDKLTQVSAEDRGTNRRVGVLDGSNLLGKLVGNDLGVQGCEVGNVWKGRFQSLLHANKVGSDEIDLIR